MYDFNALFYLWDGGQIAENLGEYVFVQSELNAS